MDEKYYIPSLKRKEYDELYIKSIVYFIFIFIAPLLVIGFYSLINMLTNNTIFTTFYKEYDILVLIVSSLVFIVLFILSRKKFIDSLTTVYYIKGDNLIKGKLDIKKINSNKKKLIKDFLLSSFIFEKRYNTEFLNNSENNMNYLTTGIVNNTDYSYVTSNFKSDLYIKTIYDNVIYDVETSSEYVYRDGKERIAISKLYTNDNMYITYDHYYGNKGTFSIGIKNFFMMALCVVLLCSIDLLINYNLKYLDKINGTIKNINYRLVDYGYKLKEDGDILNLDYSKDEAKINIKINKLGKITSVESSIVLVDFTDIATIRYIMSDISRCDSSDIDNYVTRLYDCLEDKCTYEDFSVNCKQYKYFVDKKDGKYVIINTK